MSVPFEMAPPSPCNDGCCGDEVADISYIAVNSPKLAIEPVKDDCHDGCCGNVDGDSESSCPSSPQTPGSAIASVTVQICRAEEFPSCCDAAPAPRPFCSVVPCKAPSAPVCCSSQVGIAPTPTSATALNSVKSSASPDLRGWGRAALLISLATIVWNVIEGSLSVVYGAEDVSVALLGFGADSWIEVLSALVVAHRFWRHESLRAETVAKEKRAILIIGVLLLLLALSIVGGGVSSLALNEIPDGSVSGLAISSAAIAVMTALYFAKVRIAFALSSSTMESDAQCSLCCIQLSFVLFVGSLVAHFAGDAVWWFDGVTALVIALLVAREGYNAVRTAQRPDFNGCSCCEESNGWYMSWLRRQQQSKQ